MAGGTASRQGRSGRSSRGGRSSQRLRPMAEINVTPMVDVMLVLLIIFMVAAPMLTVGVPVKLPKTAATPLPSEEEQPLTLTISADGQLILQKTPINREQLIPKLRAIAAERRNDKIFLRADGSVPYALVMQVMGALNAGGFRDIGLVTDTGGPKLDGQDN
ncbi:MAG: protein TolR [Paracoccaceae bacterium]|nr:protein TolR [Paracoccaceae bacterium]